MTSVRGYADRQSRKRWWLNAGVTVGSVFLCLLILPMRLPGMELLGVTPNWLLVWVVAWSVKRDAADGVIAGLSLGLLQDAMTANLPTHTLGLMLVGFLTGRLQKQRYIQEDIVSVALIVFGMAVIAETCVAIQVSLQLILNTGTFWPSLSAVWLYHQRVALSSAIMSSLWAPALYYPLNRWWERQGMVEN